MIESNSPVDVVVLAAGKGERMGLGINKMFCKIEGIPILYRTLSRMNSCKAIGRIILVMQQNDLEMHEEMVGRFGRLSKIKATVLGGEERSNSVRKGLKYLLDNPESDVIMTHDGARPFFTEDLILRLVMATKDNSIAIPAQRVYETIRRKQQGRPTEVVNREQYFTIQTPQTFQLSDVDNCFFSDNQIRFNLTDEASYFERKNYKVCMVPGEKWNIKITIEDDITWAEMLLNRYPFLRLEDIEKT